MADKMLIDASHEEETRVVVVRGNRIEEFDFESQHKKQLRGNIYLAKVTRVEPSLQAAFVDYGGNRHGFLAFSEIHPDYYQIPLADREALLKEANEDDDGDDAETSMTEPAEASEKAAEADGKPKPRTRRGRAKSRSKKAEEATQEPEKAASAEAPAEPVDASKAETKSDDTSEAEAPAEAAEAAEETAKPKPRRRRKPAAKKAAKAEGETDAAAEGGGETASEDQASGENGSDDENKGGPTHMAAEVDADTISEDVDDDDDSVESVGAEDAMEEVPDNGHRRMRKQYRIQEVIKRRQILLVQVAKEERGNKGAALTTYLSLAGRYSVLMPNTARGGGISRKITNPADRKRLKEVAKGLEVPQGMGVILRTAGANRTKAEVKRDFEYLMRLWENVRSKTLTSTAPCLVYEEGSLIKRSIRDLYNKDISEVIVSGDEGYREAKDFMKMLMPSHAKVVQRYRDIHPIYSRSGIEAQLDRMLQPQVTLKSGGYLIINQTEALVAIDVNSGRSTREHSIEDTALQTNLEAAEEVARQLRLRDLAGLVVIDFIDMEEKRNNRAVEKKLKECLKNDRARIQVGRISHFGLLEMSRQRIRASVLESTTQVCSHCGGTGHVLSQSSVALHVLRGVEEYLLKNTTHNITVRTTPEIAPYLLNQKRNTIVDYENRFGVEIIVEADGDLENSHFEIDRRDPVENPVKIEALFNLIEEPEEDVVDVPDFEDADESDSAPASSNAGDSNGDEEGGRSRRKRRRRRGGRNGGQQNGSSAESDQSQDDDDTGSADDNAQEASNSSDDDGDKPRRKRRRGKRGGRRNRSDDNAQQETSGDSAEAEGKENASEAVAESKPDEAEPENAAPAAPESTAETAETAASEVVTERPAEETAEANADQPTEITEDEAMAEIEGRKPRRRRKPKAEKAEAAAEETVAETAEAKPAAIEETETKVEVEQPADEEAPEAETEAETKAAETSSDEDKVETKRANRGANVASSEPVVTSNGAENDDEPAKPKRGWWQRRGFF
ncbi:Rne/Rng family ribonuclease [Martelella lutilitoris]|uniref:Ribonuclease E n=1 Tax=Martelella lutilitoris TaxID=2583532 RepID=A0A5C4JR64_9HYPH|nr:ribonuclease E/G [Martelella lutilitoris]TNB47906.1 Rne/Rng family ribonuclease [Martelella lutilitoris]